MILSKYGEIIKREWLFAEKIRKNVVLDEFVIMPNHLHGIIAINSKNQSDSNRENLTEKKSKHLKSGSLGAIVGQFKARVSRKINSDSEISFGWQRNYYEHIIRSERELEKIRYYININPLKWEKDKYNPLKSG